MISRAILLAGAAGAALVATPALAERVVDYRVVRAPSWDTRWSDHAPVVADYVF